MISRTWYSQHLRHGKVKCLVGCLQALRLEASEIDGTDGSSSRGKGSEGACSVLNRWYDENQNR